MMVGERGLRFSARSALRAVAGATLSRFARLKPPSEVLILFCYERKKPAFCKAGFSNMVGERGFEPPTHWSQTSCATKLRYSPMGANITAVTLERQSLFPKIRLIAWKASSALNTCLLNKIQARITALSHCWQWQVPGTSYSLL